jgi:gentisate 1,2-dioxygenase
VRDALDRLQAFEPDPYDGYIIEYVNPETGGAVMPTMSFTMQLLKGGQKTEKHRHTSSTVYCVADGEGYTQVDDVRLQWKKNDVFVVPTWAWHAHGNADASKPAVLFGVTDSPTIQTLSLYREQGMAPTGEIKVIAEPCEVSPRAARDASPKLRARRATADKSSASCLIYHPDAALAG